MKEVEKNYKEENRLTLNKRLGNKMKLFNKIGINMQNSYSIIFHSNNFWQSYIFDDISNSCYLLKYI